MLAQMEEDVLRHATSSADYRPILSTFVILAANPVRYPEGTARVADRSTAWPRGAAHLDEEPTWEDAEWQ